MTKAANSGLPLPETSKYFKVRPNTMMVYHQASRDTAHKVAGILSGHAPASKPPAPGLLDEDFLLESTSLGIPENNAEVVAGVVASPAQDVPHVPEQVAPIAPVDVPHVPEQVAPIAPVDVPPVPEQVAPIAPVADSSPGKISVTSSQSACSVDLLADCKSASSNSEWDYEERPLTQVSLKRSFDQGREEYKAAAYAAPPSAENARISQDLSDAPMPFPKMRRPKAPAAERRVAAEFIYHRCSREINVWRKLRGMTRVFCAMCNAPYHETCMGKGAKDGSMLGPCCAQE